MKVLIIDSLPRSDREKVEELGGRGDVSCYQTLLGRFAPQVEVATFATTEGREGPSREALSEFAGLIWTGSPLSVNATDEPVRVGRDVVTSAIRAGLPCFGSCWGLQLAAVALGGKEEAARKGPQVKVERSIRTLAAGRSHPLFEGKPDHFQAVQVHWEEITCLPPGGVALAQSSSVEVEAAEIVCGLWRFWGTQYHPEFTSRDLGIALQVEGERLVKAGAYSSLQEVCSFARDLQASDPAALQHLYGFDATLFAPDVRGAELRNWLVSIGAPAVGGSKNESEAA